MKRIDRKVGHSWHSCWRNICDNSAMLESCDILKLCNSLLSPVLFVRCYLSGERPKLRGYCLGAVYPLSKGQPEGLEAIGRSAFPRACAYSAAAHIGKRNRNVLFFNSKLSDRTAFCLEKRPHGPCTAGFLRWAVAFSVLPSDIHSQKWEALL